jgi:hypothetical protein
MNKINQITQIRNAWTGGFISAMNCDPYNCCYIKISVRGFSNFLSF